MIQAKTDQLRHAQTGCKGKYNIALSRIRTSCAGLAR